MVLFPSPLLPTSPTISPSPTSKRNVAQNARLAGIIDADVETEKGRNHLPLLELALSVACSMSQNVCGKKAAGFMPASCGETADNALGCSK